LVSLLASDLPRARAFVTGHLGPLASTEEPAERLRETVLADEDEKHFRLTPHN